MLYTIATWNDVCNGKSIWTFRTNYFFPSQTTKFESWCLNFLAWTCQNGLQIIAQTFGHFRSSKMEKNALRKLNSICCLDHNLWKHQKFSSVYVFFSHEWYVFLLYYEKLIWNPFFHQVNKSEKKSKST